MALSKKKKKADTPDKDATATPDKVNAADASPGRKRREGETAADFVRRVVRENREAEKRAEGGWVYG